MICVFVLSVCIVNASDYCHKQVNPQYICNFEEKGMHFVGHSEDDERMEIMELDSKNISFILFLFMILDALLGPFSACLRSLFYAVVADKVILL